jgi:hypothetical protein
MQYPSLMVHPRMHFSSLFWAAAGWLVTTAASSPNAAQQNRLDRLIPNMSPSLVNAKAAIDNDR